MKIGHFLRTESIFLNVDLPDKDAVIRFAADMFAQHGVVKNSASIYAGLKSREEILSTGIGNGIGIPHTDSAEATNAALLLLRLAKPIDFGALDALPVDVVLAVVVPDNNSVLHLQMLAGISRLCRKTDFLKAVREAETPRSLLLKINELEG
ncbi:MAG: PTS sugar transporter subunit IIA [Desulforhabdus sp.]|jgi:mannitol/fructose-specific phosphotransferase system IIA component (Ntr-type)|nr:PTS sugar transporter subunit IIA [Desulforhabdus sp.]